jgi:hypothetical protein
VISKPGCINMPKMRKFNSKAQKLSTPRVKEMYERLLEGETQGAMAREYGLSVIQVGRIARGESRAQETGAQGPLPSRQEMTEVDYEASAREVLSRLAAMPKREPPPNPMWNPGAEDQEPSGLVEKLLSEANEIRAKDLKVDEMLDDLTKGDSTK